MIHVLRGSLGCVVVLVEGGGCSRRKKPAVAKPHQSEAAFQYPHYHIIE